MDTVNTDRKPAALTIEFIYLCFDKTADIGRSSGRVSLHVPSLLVAFEFYDITLWAVRSWLELELGGVVSIVFHGSTMGSALIQKRAYQTKRHPALLADQPTSNCVVRLGVISQKTVFILAIMY